MHEILEPVSGFLKLGGPVVSLLLVLSVIALASILLKLYQFWKERVGSNARVNKALAQWQRGNQEGALSILRDPLGLVEEATAITMRALQRPKANKAEIEEAVSVVAADRLHKLQSGFRILDSIAQVAPLLGLFGTVLGMITAFQKLQEAGNSVDPSILAGGIWVALLTTAVGLAVAMPVSLVLTWFETRLESERVAVETSVGGLLTGMLKEPQQKHTESTAMKLANAY